MKILVIGGGGYVGSLLVERLLKQKYEVLVLDLFLYENPKFLFSDIINSQLLTIIKGDVRDKDLLDNIISSVNIDSILSINSMDQKK